MPLVAADGPGLGGAIEPIEPDRRQRRARQALEHAAPRPRRREPARQIVESIPIHLLAPFDTRRPSRARSSPGASERIAHCDAFIVEQ
jgi:hypothetical protein